MRFIFAKHTRNFFLGALFFPLLFVVLAPRANALNATPTTGFPLIGGAVNVIIPNGSTTYIGGSFAYVAPSSTILSPGVPLDRITGSQVVGFSAINSTGTVSAVAPDGSGGFYVGGTFTTIGGFFIPDLAHVLSSGLVDSSWNPNASGTISTLALSTSTLYAGGAFTTIGGQARNNIAELSLLTASSTAWDPNASGTISTLALSTSTLYAGGDFTAIGGQTRNRIAEVSLSTASTTAWDPNAGSTVNTLALSTSTIYVGGDFTAIGGQTRNRIAELSLATASSTAWNPNSGSTVNTLALSTSTLYVGGVFTTISGQTRNRIAEVSLSTASTTAWDPNANSTVSALALSTSTIYVGGGFTTIGGQTRSCIAELSLGTASSTSWDPGASGTVNALALSTSTSYIGGSFSFAGNDLMRPYLLEMDTTSKSITSWNPGANGAISALVLSTSTIYAGGGFTTVGGQTRNHIAEVSLATASSTSWNPNIDFSVNALALSTSTIYAGGVFGTVGGQSRARGAEISLTTAAPTAWNLGLSNFRDTIATLTISTSTLYVGGTFISPLGGKSRINIAEVSLSTASSTAWNPNNGGGGSTVNSIILSTSTLYVGGGFTGFGTTARNYIAELSLTTASATAWNPNAGPLFSSVPTLALSTSTIYAGGSFTTIGGQSRSKIAEISLTTASSTAWNPNMNGTVSALSFSSSTGTLFAGGSFTTVGGQQTGGFAEFEASVNTTPAVSFALSTSSYPETAGVVSLDISFSSTPSISSSFTYTISTSSTAVSNVNYSGLQGNTVAVPAGQTTSTISFSLLDDHVYSSGYTLIVTITTSTNLTLGSIATHVMTITESDSAPVALGGGAAPAPSLLVNGGVSRTASSVVSLTISGPPITSLRLSSTSDFAKASLAPASSVQSWNLCGESASSSCSPGLYTVYAKVNDSQIISASITYAPPNASSPWSSTSSPETSFLATRVAELQTQLRTLQAQLTGTSSSVASGSRFIFTHDLFFGMKGSWDVYELQRILQKEGFFSHAFTYHFGAMTRRAVLEYQRAHQVPATGYVGPLTRGVLNGW